MRAGSVTSHYEDMLHPNDEVDARTTIMNSDIALEQRNYNKA